jgi:UDP-N-acetylglucosamine 1-carboxyvinyltransferase
MPQFVIDGGRRLEGELTVSGNKNAALPMLAACLLTDEEVSLWNVPLIRDVQTMLKILEDLGVDVRIRGHNVRLRAKGIRKRRLSSSLCRQVRSSILFAGPMLARYGRAVVYPPGGDVIGRRRLDTHFQGLRSLGAGVEGNGCYDLRASSLHGARILLDEASVTATENIVMAAVLAEGRTTIFNAACEPHVQELCRMLNSMGADIAGIGTNYLVIEGVTRLRGVTRTVEADYIEMASFVAASALTGGSLRIYNAPLEHLDVIEKPFRKLGVQWSVLNDHLYLPGDQELKVADDMHAAIPKIEDGPWPNVPSDLLSVMLILATQAEGAILFFEKMFESRMYFVDRLIEMGARIVQCDPHRVIVTGPAPLHGTHLSSPDIRAGMALLLAALCSGGKSTIGNIESIDRGYENVDRRLRKLGAGLRRIS